MRARAARRAADAVADRLLGIGGKEPEPPSLVLRDFDRAALAPAFAAQLDHRLRDTDGSVTAAIHWLDERLADQGTTREQIVQEELRAQGAMNVTVRNVITSMRRISNIDWSEVFESVSLVDVALGQDSEFAAMDFATRNMYRRAVEEARARFGTQRVGYPARPRPPNVQFAARRGPSSRSRSIGLLSHRFGSAGIRTRDCRTAPR